MNTYKLPLNIILIFQKEIRGKIWLAKDPQKKPVQKFYKKKKKVEQKLISDIIEERYPHLDIPDHKINKFILIFNTILETYFDQENLEEIDSEDGKTDTILLVIKAVFNLIKGNIEDFTNKN